jgi:hypothetical protein
MVVVVVVVTTVMMIPNNINNSNWKKVTSTVYCKHKAAAPFHTQRQVLF